MGPERVVLWRESLQARISELGVLTRAGHIHYDDAMTQLSAIHVEVERFCLDIREEAHATFPAGRLGGPLIQRFWIGYDRLYERASEGPGQRDRARFHLDSILIALTLVGIFEEIVGRLKY